jgi:hypothetical protein
MRALEIQFHPEQVRITPEEILADLHYPASRKRRPERRRKPRRKGHA